MARFTGGSPQACLGDTALLFCRSRGSGQAAAGFRRGTFVVSASDGRPIHLWIAWLIAAAALGVAEAFTLTLAFGLLAAAALVAAIVAGVGGSVLAQVLAFAIAGAVGLLIVRPIAKRQMTHPTPVREGSYALVGKKAVVMEIEGATAIVYPRELLP